MIYIDIFNLKINITNIEIIIQWQMNKKLMTFTLYQYIEQVIRDKDIEDIVIIYIQKSFLDSIDKKNWVETMIKWQDIWKNDLKMQIDSIVYDLEQKLKDLCMISISKERNIKRFEFSMRIDIKFQVKKYILSLYHDIMNLHDIFR